MNSFNAHNKVLQLFPNLWVVGFGGAAEVRSDGKVIEEGKTAWAGRGTTSLGYCY